MLLQLALLPSLVLFIVLWRKDKQDKEPIGLLLKVFFLGALTIISAVALGSLGTNALTMVLDSQSMLFIFIDNFILTALIEEGGKYIVLKKATRKHPAFNYTFDAVVYAVVASLGFATFENILYVFENGVGTAITRAIISVPGHAMDAVFMGFYYGIAKQASVAGDEAGCKKNLVKALIVPTILHGFYDFCLSTPYDIFILIFLIFEIIFTIVTIRKFRKLSREDAPIYNPVGQSGPEVDTAVDVTSVSESEDQETNIP